jgi:hypothetical protein
LSAALLTRFKGREAPRWVRAAKLGVASLACAFGAGVGLMLATDYSLKFIEQLPNESQHKQALKLVFVHAHSIIRLFA